MRTPNAKIDKRKSSYHDRDAKEYRETANDKGLGFMKERREICL